MAQASNNAPQARTVQPKNPPVTNPSAQGNASQPGAPTVASHDKRAALKNAASTGELTALADLLDGLAIDEPLDANGTTALSVASQNGHFDIVDVLLDSGAGEGDGGVRSLANALLGAVKANRSDITDIIFTKRFNEIGKVMTVLQLLGRKPENQVAYTTLLAKFQGGANSQQNIPPAGTETTTTTTTAATTTTIITTTTAVVAPAPLTSDDFPSPQCTDDQIQDMFNHAKTGNAAGVSVCLDQGMIALKKSNSHQTVLLEAARKGKAQIVDFILAHPTASRLAQGDLQTASDAADFNDGQSIKESIKKFNIRVGPNTGFSQSELDRSNQERALNAFSKPAAQTSNSSHTGTHNTMTCGFEVSLNAAKPTSPNSSLATNKAVSVTQEMKAAMYKAAREGDLATVKTFIERGMPLDTALNSSGDTVLLLAARKGHSAIINHLIANGAVDLGYGIKKSAILAAATEAHMDIVKSLLNLFGDPEHTRTTIARAAKEQGNEFAVRTLDSIRF